MEGDLLNRVNQIEAEDAKSNKFKIIMILVGIAFLCVVVFFVMSSFGEELFDKISFFKGDVEEVNANVSGVDDVGDMNVSLNEAEAVNVSLNGTEINASLNGSSVNDTVGNVSLNPVGVIKMTKIRGVDGEYYCDNVTNPEHEVRLYTYMSVNGVRELSDEFIDSGKINNVCSFYENSSGGMNYFFKWEWDLVEGVDGYRIYQYYSWNNTLRNYSYYIDMKSDAQLLTDLGLDGWASV